MRHLEFVHQACARIWDVRLVSVTEQWAQFAVAGPKARELLNGLLDAPLDRRELALHVLRRGHDRRGDGRLFRISFSGEHGYEIAVPARYGDALFRELVARAEAMGGGAYGMEALNVLRHREGLHHPCRDPRPDHRLRHRHGAHGERQEGVHRQGRRRQRPGLMDEDREQLVGLRPVGAVQQLVAGAHLFNEGDEAIRENDQGYITSVGFSPTLGHMLGLGFLRNGRARHGERIRMVDT